MPSSNCLSGGRRRGGCAGGQKSNARPRADPALPVAVIMTITYVGGGDRHVQRVMAGDSEASMVRMLVVGKYRRRCIAEAAALAARPTR